MVVSHHSPGKLTPPVRVRDERRQEQTPCRTDAEGQEPGRRQEGRARAAPSNTPICISLGAPGRARKTRRVRGESVRQRDGPPGTRRD